jgi:hypothetical protein
VPSETILPALMVVGLTVLVAIATSLKGIPDPVNATWWQVLISRSLRSAGQVALPVFATAAALDQIDWSNAYTVIVGAFLTTLVLTALSVLPQSEPVVQLTGDVKVDADTLVVSNPDGEHLV